MPLMVAWTCSVAEEEERETTKRFAVFSMFSILPSSLYHLELVAVD